MQFEFMSFIVKEYRQTKNDFNILQQDFEEFQRSTKSIFMENQQLIAAKMDERNALICAVIEGSRKIEQTRNEVILFIFPL